MCCIVPTGIDIGSLVRFIKTKVSARKHAHTHTHRCVPLPVQQRWGADMWSRKYQIPSVKVPFPWLLLTVAKRDHHYHIRDLFGVLGSDRGRSLVPGPPCSWRSLKSHACLRGGHSGNPQSHEPPVCSQDIQPRSPAHPGIHNERATP